MRKVLLDTRVAVGGTRRYIEVLTEGLRTEGSFEMLSVSAESWTQAPFTPWGRRSVAARARESDAELIHGCHVEVPRTALPTVATVHDLIPFDHPASLRNPLKRTIYERAVEFSLKRATRIIAVSTATADQVMARGVSADRVTVVANGVAPTFSPLQETEKEEARRRFARGKPYVAALMSSKSHKNCAVLGEVTVPDGTEFVRMPSGELDETSLRLFYGGAQCFVLPSLLEGYGYPLAEALACGTPVVCGGGVGALEHLSAGAVVVDVEMVTAISEAVLRLCSDQELRAGLSSEGLKAVALLTPQHMGQETAAVYEAALSGLSH